MREIAASASPSAEARADSRTLYPQIFRRTFECGHPEEFIEVQLLGDGGRVHNLVTLETFQACNRGKNQPVHIEARCLGCAKAAKEKDDKDPSVRPKRTLGAYQAGTSSTVVGKASRDPRYELDDVLERYKRSSEQKTGVRPHPRVPEEEHRAHRREVQAKAVACPGKWLAVPARRVWNAPIQKTDEGEVAIHRRAMSHLSQDEDNVFLQPSIHAACEEICYEEDNNAQSDKLLLDQEDGEESSHSQQPVLNADKDTGDIIIVRADIDVVEDLSRLSLARSDSSFRLAAMNFRSLSGSKLHRNKKIPEAAVLNANDSGSFLLDYATDLRSPQTANRLPASQRESASIERLIDQYVSPFDDSSDPPLVDTKYENPRPAPVVPKREPLNFTKQRSSISTRASTQSEPVLTNFRRLRLHTQHSAQAVEKTEPDSESPDWACQTSLAIEAGRISMDSVSMQNGESASSKHISEAMRSPTKIMTTGRRTLQEAGPGERRKTYSSPSSEYSPDPSTIGRHSEGALPAVRGASAVYSLERLERMEIAMKEEMFKRDSAQAATPMDLNKSLPALPPRESGKNDEE